MLFVLLIGSQFFLATLLRVVLSDFPGLPSWVSEIGEVLVYILAFALPIFVGLRRSDTGFSELITTPLPRLALFGAVFLTFFGWIFLNSQLGLLVQYFFPVPDHYAQYMEEIVVNQSFLRAIITVAFLASILEEILCRGIIGAQLLRQAKVWPAIILSSLFFAIMHMNIWQGIPAFFTGLLLGWMYYKTGSLWIPMWGHFVNNGVIIILSRISGQVEVSQESTGEPDFNLLSLVLILLFFGTIFRTGLKWFQKLVRDIPKPPWGLPVILPDEPVSLEIVETIS